MTPRRPPARRAVSIFPIVRAGSRFPTQPATADVERQARVFASMRQSYYGDNPDNIRRAILNGTVKGNDLKAVFVGRDAYVTAGGRIERDLFGSEAEETWVDVELLEDLASARLEAAAADAAQAQGLAFVTPVLATHVPYDLERQVCARGYARGGRAFRAGGRCARTAKPIGA